MVNRDTVVDSRSEVVTVSWHVVMSRTGVGIKHSAVVVNRGAVVPESCWGRSKVFA